MRAGLGRHTNLLLTGHVAALPVLVILSGLQENLHGSSIRRNGDASHPDVRQVIISEEAIEAQADGCSQRQITQPAGWPFRKHPAGISTLSKGIGSFLLSPEGKLRLAYSLMAATMGAVVTFSLRREAVEGCDGCGRRLDRREGGCRLRQLQQVQRDCQRRGWQECQVMPCAPVSEVPP